MATSLTTFASSMQQAIDKTVMEDDDDLYADEDYENDLLSDGLATGAAGGAMLEVPATQGDSGVFGFGAEEVDYEAEQQHEKESKNELAAEHTTLTALTREIHATDLENINFIELYDEARPHDELRARQGIIEQMEGETKMENVQLFNCNVVLFKKMKEDEKFRKWMTRFVKQVRCSFALRFSLLSSLRFSLCSSLLSSLFSAYLFPLLSLFSVLFSVLFSSLFSPLFSPLLPSLVPAPLFFFYLADRRLLLAQGQTQGAQAEASVAQRAARREGAGELQGEAAQAP